MLAVKTFYSVPLGERVGTHHTRLKKQALNDGNLKQHFGFSVSVSFKSSASAAALGSFFVFFHLIYLSCSTPLCTGGIYFFIRCEVY